MCQLLGMNANTPTDVMFSFTGLAPNQYSVDTVVLTYTLCSIADWEGALAQMRRVLKPGGRLLFSEHGRAPDESVRRWQTRLQPYWMKVAGGCRLDRDIPALLEQADFKPEVQSRYLPGPKVLSYHYWGEAVAA